MLSNDYAGTECRCFGSYSGVGLPLNLVNPIGEDALDNRNTFIRGYFDTAGRLLACEKVVYGEVEMAHVYAYHANGKLKQAEIRMLDEEPTVLQFADDGSGPL